MVSTIERSLPILFVMAMVFACGDDDSANPNTVTDAVIAKPQADDSVGLTDGGMGQAAAVVNVETLVDTISLPLQFGVGTFSFEVGEDVLSLAVIVYGQATGWYGIDAWTNGDGTSLVTADWPSFEGNERGCVSCANFANQGAGASTTIAPNRPGAEVRPGMHRISVVGWVDGLSTDEVSVRVVAKTGEALPNTGVVDLNFYLTGAQGWTSETVQTDSYFAACIARVNEVYGQIGLSVGEITFHDIDPSFAVISIADGDTSLENLVAQSTLDTTSGINIFFVDEILTGEVDYPSIPGVSASVPNPPYLPGTVASGVAVALNGPLSVAPENRFLDPPAIGQTIAHELGHALGLFHTSEYDLVSHDVYDDTPENDNEWLMHADGTGDLISPQQRGALFANPTVRHPK